MYDLCQENHFALPCFGMYGFCYFVSPQLPKETSLILIPLVCLRRKIYFLKPRFSEKKITMTQKENFRYLTTIKQCLRSLVQEISEVAGVSLWKLSYILKRYTKVNFVMISLKTCCIGPSLQFNGYQPTLQGRVTCGKQQLDN